MTQTPASLAPTPKQWLKAIVFAVESALIVLLFNALAVVLFAMDLRAPQAKRLQAKRRRLGYQTAQARG